MQRREFLVGMSLLPIAGCAGTAERNRLQGRVPAEIEEMASVVPELMRAYDIPGVSVASVRDGRKIWTCGFGVKDASSGTPVDNQTVFEAASISKTVFAYAALKLCEKGTIGLDTPLSSYTSTRLVEGDPRLDKITARQVLSHSSGLAEWRSKDEPLIRSEPGSRFRYSGEGYYYLQSVITGLTGKVDPAQCATYEADFEVCATDFDDFMKQHVLWPFGMSASGYLADSGWEQRMARGHDRDAEPLVKGNPRGSDVARYGAVGGLNMTASDYARFLVEVVAPRPPDEFRLGLAMHREMVRPQIQLPKGEGIDGCAYWALGWGVQNREEGDLLVHSGGQRGFRALALASVEKRSGFVVLTNSENGGKLIYHPKFLGLADKIVVGV